MWLPTGPIDARVATSAGLAWANFPVTKKLAGTPAARRVATMRSAPRASAPPSKVSATRFWLPGRVVAIFPAYLATSALGLGYAVGLGLGAALGGALGGVGAGGGCGDAEGDGGASAVGVEGPLLERVGAAASGVGPVAWLCTDAVAVEVAGAPDEQAAEASRSPESPRKAAR